MSETNNAATAQNADKAAKPSAAKAKPAAQDKSSEMQASIEGLQREVNRLAKVNEILQRRTAEKMSDEGYLQSLRICTTADTPAENLRVAGYVSTSNATAKQKRGGYINPADREMQFVAFGDTAQYLLDAYRYKWTVIKYYGKKTATMENVITLDGELIAKEVGVQINDFEIKKQSEELSDREAPQYYVAPEKTDRPSDQQKPAPQSQWNTAPLVPDTDEIPF